MKYMSPKKMRKIASNYLALRGFREIAVDVSLHCFSLLVSAQFDPADLSVGEHEFILPVKDVDYANGGFTIKGRRLHISEIEIEQ